MRTALLTVVLALTLQPLAAQNPANSQVGWTSWGVLPFSAVDIGIVKTSTSYVMYYTGQSNGPKPARAFSSDLRTWTPDTADFCSSTGELCTAATTSQALGHRSIIQLPDGRYRLFREAGDPSGNTLVSFTSTDGLRWTRDPGVRMTRDTSSIWERGRRTFVGLTLTYLPDGRLRLYYMGEVSPDINPIYQNCGGCGIILSAISSDNGLTFVREPDVRVNPRILGPVSDTGNFHIIGFSVVPTSQGYRIYTTASEDGAVTYFSRDGLSFILEGQIPALGSDIFTVTMPDGRLWLVSSLLSSAGELAHMMVYGAQPFVVNSVRWDRDRQLASINLAGSFTEPVTANLIIGRSVCPGISTPEQPYCPWHPENYQADPATIASPTATIRYTGPVNRTDGIRDKQLLFEVVSGDTRAVGAVYCMIELGSGLTPFCSTSPLPTERPSSPSSTFSISSRGGASTTSAGTGSLSTGYARIQAAQGSTAPSGIAIFGFRSGGVLVSEAGVPDSPLLTAGRVYAEVSADTTLNTGIAFANPDSQTAAINFRLTNTEGTDFQTGSFTLGAGQQFAEFLNGARFNSGAGIQGTFSFTSSVPVSVIALRGFTNQRGEFLMTTLAVADTSVAPAAGVQYVPHFADGGGWTTQILLVNPTDTAMSGTIQFFSTGDTNAPGAMTSSTPYSVHPRSSQKLSTAGTAAVTATGSVRIVPTGTGAAPTPLAVFTFKPAEFTLTEAGAPGNSGTAFRTYVESSGTAGQSGNIQSGIAIANTADTIATVTLELFALDGSSAGSSSLSLPASGQAARFLSQFFPTLPASFQGVMRITSNTPIAVTGLRSRINERGDFLITNTPPSPEMTTPSSASRVFPHLANGGGYTTQFILYNVTAGQAPVGELRFYSQDGSAMNLPAN